MATRKATLTAEEKLAFATQVKIAIDSGATLWVIVPHTSASNMSYTIRARLLGGSNNADLWLNYWLAAETNGTLNASDDWKQNGCGFDRSFEVACDIANILRRHGLAALGYSSQIKRSWF